MAFNVCDKNGKHIGIIVDNAYDVKNAALVAITHLTAEDIKIDFEGIKIKIATMCQCRTMLGKVNEDKLDKELKKIWKENYSDFGNYNQTYILKLLLFADFREFYQYIHLDEEMIQGYIFVSTRNIKFYNENCIIMEEPLDYIEHIEDVLIDGKPIFGKIVDYPELTIDAMGAEGLFLGGGLADLGGRNHTHETKLKIMSGNVVNTFEFPMHIHAKKGMSITIYAQRQVIQAIFCDGIIYKA